MKLRYWLFLLPATVLAAGDAIPGADVEFFESKVRPLLVEHCYECHSEEKKIKGGLRLDSREGWMAGGDSGAVLIAGKPEDSLLMTAIRYKDEDLEMPPKRKLSDGQIAVLEEWIRQGAPDPRTGAAAPTARQTGLTIEEGRKFWAFAPVVAPPMPDLRDALWPRGSIDVLALHAMEGKGLKPGKDAAPEILARRLYFSLIGMPPTPEQIDAFVADQARDPEGASWRLIDELLDSPHFGETWGRHWLDVARFAESSGGGRTLLFKDAWRYRDYVIDAMNRDMPFDRFLREQIAGDLLPATDLETKRRQLVATAFLALGPTNYEEQDKQQLRFDVIDEQLDTLGKAVLGQTIGCARCHDHKFDPIPQTDYYALAGIFASTRTLLNYSDNVARWIDRPLPAEPKEEEIYQQQEERVATIREKIASGKKELSRAAAALARTPVEKGMPVSASALPGVIVDDSEAVAVGEWKHSTNVRTYVGEGYRHDMNDGKGTKTLTFVPKLPKTGRYEVRLAYSASPGRATRVPVTILHADGEETVFLNQEEQPVVDGRFAVLGRYRFEKDGAGFVLVTNEGTKGYVIADAVQFLPDEMEGPVADATGAPAEATTELRSVRESLKVLEAELAEVLQTSPKRPVTMAVRDDEEIADTPLRVRGQVQHRGPVVPRGFLRVAQWDTSPVLPKTQSGRLELADWLAHPRNPLTARVFVNRVWHWLFGNGLVRTVDNFGVTGETPSHPELLDYLAARFVEQGWSVKALVREIVLSRTWQLASAAPGDADPDNRFLSHASRRRLAAEPLRDAILSVSGQLRLEIGGQGIAGAGEINANDTSAQNIEYGYQFKDARRSVYTPAFRNKRLELFEVFDFGDINATLGRRYVSTVAPQALYLLNHPFVLEQASVAARKALDSSATDSERLERVFRAALGRLPHDREREVCMSLLAAGGAGPAEKESAWADIHHSLFACLDFRYLD